MARNRLTIIACLLALVAWGQIQYRATLFGHLAAPATPLVVDGSVIVMMGTTVLQGASLEDPAVVLWSFNLDESFCCSAGNDTNCGPVPAFQVIRGRGTVLVGCGPYLAVLNTTTGANMSAWYTIPEGDLLSQFAVVSSTEVTVVSLQSCRVFALNISTWDLLWQVNTSAVSQPLVATADNGLAVVFSFASAYRGTVDGYSVVKGTHLWSLTVGMWSTQQIPNNPWQSDTVFVWCGPEFATVRMLHVPTGAYHQWISDTMVQFATPTSAGLVVAVTLTHVTVLNASNGAVLWSVRPGSNIAYARVSYGGQYVTVYPPEAVRDHIPTTVYAIADGTVVGNCGYGHCSEPCVTQAMRCGTVAVVAMCNASNSTSAVLALLDLRTSRDTALDGAPIRVKSSSPVAPVSVQALTEDGLVAVTTATGLRYLQLSSVNGMSSPNQFVPSLEAPSFDPRFVVSSIGAAFVVSIAAGVAAVRRQRERRRAVAVAEEQLVVAAIAATSRVEVAESITYDRPFTSYTVPPS